MSDYFFDSSALLKSYVVEIGTTWVRSINSASSGNGIIIAQITSVEIVSAVARRSREGSVTSRTAQAIRFIVDRHVSRQYIVVNLTSAILRRAEDLLLAHALRAYDSIQLSTALDTNDYLLSTGQLPLTFVSSDARLLTVAKAEGLATDDPTAHP